MKVKVARYIARLLAENGITQVFSVTGGGAMHLNDALGHEVGLNKLYMHHEQACAIAAESYARIYNKPACLCVTTGPGGTNAITGVVGAWLDSIPMIVLSGQVRYDTTARWSGTGIRAMGDQEYDITKSIDGMTKYSEMITDPGKIRYALEKCIWLSQTGRPGPCWLDIPLDIQGAYVEEDDLYGFDPEEYLKDVKERTEILKGSKGKLTPSFIQKNEIPPEKPSIELIKLIVEKIKNSKRPVFYTGNGIRIAGAHELFKKVSMQLGIPVVTGWNNQDCIEDDNPLYVGRAGNMGDRPGNFAVQNADLIFAVGSRLSIRQVGYNYKTWAREAYVMVCDVDAEELKKPSVHCDLPIHANAKDLLCMMNEYLSKEGYGISQSGLHDIHIGAKAPVLKTVFDGGEGLPGKNWLETCAYWKKRYPVYQDKFAASGADEPANVYEFFRVLSERLSEDQVTVVGNGSPCVVGGHSYIIKNGTRFISNSAIASMGYDLPAAIGACVACHDVCGKVYPVDFDAVDEAYEKGEFKTCSERGENAGSTEATLKKNICDRERFVTDKAYALGELESANRNKYWAGHGEVYPPYYEHDIICPTGDGSIQMNLQELQTIISHRMPIKIFIINNNGYHSIRQTQTNLFSENPLVGVGGDSMDLSFPDFERLARAYGFPFVRARHNTELAKAVEDTLNISGPAICEIIVDTHQNFEPKSSAKKLPDGSLVSPPLEDLSPFLSDEEMDANMIIERIKE